MAWQTDMTTLLRYLINDYGDVQENTDANLQRLIVTAAQLTKMDVDFQSDYVININATGISPDPIDTQDNAFINLVTLKAACLLARGIQRKKAGHAISIKDGPSNVDGRGVAGAIKSWADSACEDYAKAELEYRMGSRNPGQAIVGPYNFDNFGDNTNGRTNYRNSYFS